MSPINRIAQTPLSAALVVFLASGCTALTNTSTSMMPWHITDPARLAPNLQSPNDSRSTGDDPPETEADSALTTPDPIPRIGSPADDVDNQTGPSLPPGGLVVDREIDLSIDVAERVQVGGSTTFNIKVKNRTDLPITDVVIESDFDAALVFPGSPEKRVRRTLGTIAPNADRELAVMLTSDKPGKHCARFTVTIAGREAAWKEVCVEYVNRKIDVSIVSPQERTVGSRVEFTIKLLNRMPHPLKDVRVAVGFDDALEAREGSTGALFEERRLRWNLGNLKAGEAVQLQVEFACVKAVENASVSVEVSGEQLPEERVSRCLRIVRQNNLLQVDVRDTRDPISVGETTVHEITILNRVSQTLHDVRLTAAVPEDLRVLSTSVRQDGREIPGNTTVSGGQIIFDPIAALPAGGKLTFRVETKALRAGDFPFTVHVRHALSRGRIVVSEPLSVTAD